MPSPPSHLSALRSLLILGLTFAAASPLTGQHPPCFNRAGAPIITIASDSLPYAAWAQLRDTGRPVIYWNAARMTTASPGIRLLVHLHECAHHVLGHVYKLPSNDEKRTFELQADCWAIQRMVEEEMITVLTLDATLEQVRNWTGDRTHLGGEALAFAFRRCLHDKTNQVLWFRFLNGLMRVSRDTLSWIRGPSIPESGDEAVRESLLNSPGTFDCEIRGGHILICKLFQGVRHERVIRRYQEIKGIIERWAGAEWKLIEQEQDDFHQPLLFLGWNELSGANLSLVVTDSNQLFFTWSPLPPDSTESFSPIGPPNR